LDCCANVSGSAAASSPGDVKVRDDVRERLIGW
jgi:hypothetical protein